MGEFKGTINRKGAPKGAKSWVQLIEEISTSSVDVAGNTQKRRVVMKLLDLCESGERWAMECLLARMAPVSSQLDVTSNGENLGAQISFVSAVAHEIVAKEQEPVLEADIVETPAPELPETIDT